MSLPPPLPPSPAPVPDAAPTACVQCGSLRFSTQTKLPVCEPCRLELVRFPFPKWVRAAAVAVAVLVVLSLGMSAERLQAALHFARTKRMAQQQNWTDAFENYRGVMANHTDTETVLSYAEAAFNSGHIHEAAEALDSLAGRKVSKDEERSYNSLLYQFKLKRDQDQYQSQRQSQPIMPLAPLNSSPIKL